MLYIEGFFFLNYFLNILISSLFPQKKIYNRQMLHVNFNISLFGHKVTGLFCGGTFALILGLLVVQCLYLIFELSDIWVVYALILSVWSWYNSKVIFPFGSQEELVFFCLFYIVDYMLLNKLCSSSLACLEWRAYCIFRWLIPNFWGPWKTVQAVIFSTTVLVL